MDPRIQALLDQPRWHEERKRLREIILSSGLTETIKWNQLCYTYNGANVVLIFGFKAYCGPGFFKGSLLTDPDGLLHQQTEHVRAARIMRFTCVAEIDAAENNIRDFIRAAIAVEQAGLKVDDKTKVLPDTPDVLREKLEKDAKFAAAFNALTPGRRRGWLLHFNAAKQEKTCLARIERATTKILAGKGTNGR